MWGVKKIGNLFSLKKKIGILVNGSIFTLPRSRIKRGALRSVPFRSAAAAGNGSVAVC